jgi:REP element-mobilizing transposase RayT
VDLLAQIVQRHHWLCHAYCLMDTHYHLLIETPEGNLSQGARQLNGVYTQQSNRRHGRVGHVFQGTRPTSTTAIPCRPLAGHWGCITRRSAKW